MEILIPKEEAIKEIAKLVEHGLTFKADYTTYDSVVVITLTGGY